MWGTVNDLVETYRKDRGKINDFESVDYEWKLDAKLFSKSVDSCKIRD